MIKTFTKMKKDEMLSRGIESIEEQNSFYYYKQIEFNEKYKLKSKFLLLKKQYSSVIIQEKISDIRIYFSDFDVIEMLISVDKKNHVIFNKIVAQLKDFLLNKVYHKIELSIEKKVFEIQGLELLEDEFIVQTKADVDISINDLIMLINLIIEKERTAYETKGYVEGTIGKYLCFLLYNSINTEPNIKASIEEEMRKLGINIGTGIYKNRRIINGNREKKLLVPLEVIKKCIL